mgnify:CR=1 FL=1
MIAGDRTEDSFRSITNEGVHLKFGHLRERIFPQDSSGECFARGLNPISQRNTFANGRRVHDQFVGTDKSRNRDTDRDRASSFADDRP